MTLSTQTDKAARTSAAAIIALSVTIAAGSFWPVVAAPATPAPRPRAILLATPLPVPPLAMPVVVPIEAPAVAPVVPVEAPAVAPAVPVDAPAALPEDEHGQRTNDNPPPDEAPVFVPAPVLEEPEAPNTPAPPPPPEDEHGQRVNEKEPPPGSHGGRPAPMPQLDK